MALLLIDKLLEYIDTYEYKLHLQQMLVFITGPPASGKTTLGENLRKENDFIHWDADQWLNGTHPINDAAKTVNLESDEYKNRSPEIAKAWDIATKNGYYKLFANEKPEPSAFEALYGLMAKQINVDRCANVDKNMVITQALFSKSSRDYMRKALGDNLIFIILNTSKHLLLDRMLERTQNECDKLGITLEQRIKSWKPDFTVEDFKQHSAQSCNGFELIEKNEPNTYQINVNDKEKNAERVLMSAQNILNLHLSLAPIGRVHVDLGQ